MQIAFPRWRVIIPLALVMAVVFALNHGVFVYTSICSQCGMLKTSRVVQIPGTLLTLFPLPSSLEETELSKALARSGLVSAHDHHWLFCQGSGNGALCALGDGRFLMETATAPHVAALIDACHHYDQMTFGRRIVSLSLHPDSSRAVRYYFSNIPAHGFANAEELQDWIADRESMFNFSISRADQP